MVLRSCGMAEVELDRFANLYMDRQDMFFRQSFFARRLMQGTSSEPWTAEELIQTLVEYAPRYRKLIPPNDP